MAPDEVFSFAYRIRYAAPDSVCSTRATPSSTRDLSTFCAFVSETAAVSAISRAVFGETVRFTAVRTRSSAVVASFHSAVASSLTSSNSSVSVLNGAMSSGERSSSGSSSPVGYSSGPSDSSRGPGSSVITALYILKTRMRCWLRYMDNVWLVADPRRISNRRAG